MPIDITYGGIRHRVDVRCVALDDHSTTFGAVLASACAALDLDERRAMAHANDRARARTIASEDVITSSALARGLRIMITGHAKKTAERNEGERAKASASERATRTFEMERERERARTIGDTNEKNEYCETTDEIFASIAALDVTGRANAPPRARAEAMLRRLATDPGVVGAARKHSFKVGALREMPPEGLVGVSQVCVLGYNENRGQAIYLRLRTDDWSGFRDYVTVRKTLMHELAHNVYGDHGEGFKALNSQLNDECEMFDWKRARDSRTTRRAPTAYEPKYDSEPSRGAMAATKASSGSSLGGGASSTALSAEEMRAKRLARLGGEPTNASGA